MQTNVSISAALMLAVGAAAPGLASDWPQWRGPNRNGISTETGLLQAWPEGGPKLRWKVTDLGMGYSTPVVVGQRLYLLANEGVDNEFVQAHATTDGRRLWRTRLGKVGNPNMQPNFYGARSTPTVVGEVLYALSSDGDLACVELDSGRIRWQHNLRTEFGGQPGDWAYAESPLVDGDTVLCTPGGSQATLLALNRHTGEVIWKAALPEADAAAYASAIIVEVGGIKQYVQLLQKGLVGLEAKTGRLLWRYAKPVSRFNANIPTPLAAEGCVYVASAGTGAGAVRLVVEEGRVQPRELYFDPKLPTAIGGVVKVGDCLYGTTAKALVCLDFTTGQVRWEAPALGAASLCMADGRLYLHGENGDVGLVDPAPEGYRPKGRFTPPDQPKRRGPMEKAWAYPVVAHGCLYIRDHHLLWCYDVKAPQ